VSGNKVPNSNIQAPEKFQPPSTNWRARTGWTLGHLVLLWMLELGIWSFSSEAAENAEYEQRTYQKL
jgi:hypothetical protein